MAHRSSSFTVLGFDLGGTNAKMWIGREIPLPTEELSKRDQQTILETLAQHIKQYDGVEAVGVALACTMVPEKGDRRILSTSTKFALLANQEHRGSISLMKAEWQKMLGKKVFILNDGEAAAIAAYKHLQEDHPHTAYQNVLVVTLGTSIGVGYIFNGQAYIGPYPSRASHIILDPAGDWCLDENHRGCWKTLAGQDARKKLAGNMGLVDQSPGEKSPMDTEAIAVQAERGSRKAILYFHYYAEAVARGIATIVSAVPVECVVIAGGVAGAGTVLMDPLRNRLARGDLIDPDLAPFIDFVQVDGFSVAHGAWIYASQQHRAA